METNLPTPKNARVYVNLLEGISISIHFHAMNPMNREFSYVWGRIPPVSILVSSNSSQGFPTGAVRHPGKIWEEMGMSWRNHIEIHRNPHDFLVYVRNS
jgi:hypothetical protein